MSQSVLLSFAIYIISLPIPTEKTKSKQDSIEEGYCTLLLLLQHHTLRVLFIFLKIYQVPEHSEYVYISFQKFKAYLQISKVFPSRRKKNQGR